MSMTLENEISFVGNLSNYHVPSSCLSLNDSFPSVVLFHVCIACLCYVLPITYLWLVCCLKVKLNASENFCRSSYKSTGK